MAIYERRCGQGHDFEVLAKISERDEPATCPKCKGDSERVVALIAPVPHYQKLRGIEDALDETLERLDNLQKEIEGAITSREQNPQSK